MKHFARAWQFARRALRSAGNTLYALLRLFYPQYCLLCDTRLPPSEHFLCAACTAGLPRLLDAPALGNRVERIFLGKIPSLVRAHAYIYYEAGGEVAQMVYALKYGDSPQLGIKLGRSMAYDMPIEGFFTDIDCIVPLPLSKKRLRKRGYNQSERLAQGISQVTGLPVRCDIVERAIDNPSQTQLSAQERERNVQGIFRLCPTKDIANQHILLVDDIITTGSTLLSCASVLSGIPGLRISILALGLAGRHPIDRLTLEPLCTRKI